MIIPCGKCINCRINYASEWAGRLYCENLHSIQSYFITLTYNQNNSPALNCDDITNQALGPKGPNAARLLVKTNIPAAVAAAADEKNYLSLSKTDCQLFFKRLRKKIQFRYYLCGEYGDTTLRAHYHALLFFNKKIDLVEINNIVSKAWGHGFVVCKDVIPEHYTYVSKYLVKRFTGYFKKEFYKQTGLEPEFSLSSRRPAIGFIDNYDELINTMTNGFIFSPQKKFLVSKYLKSKFRDSHTNLYESLNQIRKQFIIDKDLFDEQNDPDYYNYHKKVELVEQTNKRADFDSSITKIGRAHV